MSIGSTIDTKEQVRVATDIVDLIGNYLQLRRQGRNYVATCPWHDDRRPSLQINSERQTWKCWVCNVGGDVFSFVMRHEGIEFREALEMLADKAGITLQRTPGIPSAKPGSVDDKRTLYDAMKWADRQFHECLLNSSEAAPARQYLKQRGISEYSIQRYHLGYSPKQWQWLVDRSASTPFSQKILQAIGLMGISSTSGRSYDFFRGRIMFPIRDPQRRTIAFGGRVIPETADDRSGKYVNTSETRLFSKSDQLYGLDIAKEDIARKREVLVVEGYTDVIMSDQYGIENIVAVLGTAIGVRHIRLLRRYADRITLVLDGDEAGQKRMNEILELFVAEEVDLRMLTLPEGCDPCDFLQNQGADALRELAASAVDALEHKISLETSGIDVLRDTHLAHQALGRVVSTLARAPRLQVNTDSNRRLKEQQIINRLARVFRIPTDTIRERLTELRRATTQQNSNQQNSNEQPPETTIVDSVLVDPRELELLEIVLAQPDTASQATNSISADQLKTGPLREIYTVILTLVASQEIPNFNRILTQLEQPELKNLLLDIDEQSRQKAALTTEKPETRLNNLIDSFRLTKEEEADRIQRAVLDDHHKSADEKLDALRELFDRKKNRIGTYVPTDG